MFAETGQNGFVLTPGRYVGASVEDLDDVDFQEKVAGLVSSLESLTRDSERLDSQIKKRLGELGF